MMKLLFLKRPRLTGYSLSDQTLLLITGGILLVSIIVIILIIWANRK